jgi:hypothetical protein
MFCPPVLCASQLDLTRTNPVFHGTFANAFHRSEVLNIQSYILSHTHHAIAMLLVTGIRVGLFGLFQLRLGGPWTGNHWPMDIFHVTDGTR